MNKIKIVCHKCKKLLGYLLIYVDDKDGYEISDDKDDYEISEIAEDTKDNLIGRFTCKECVEETEEWKSTRDIGSISKKSTRIQFDGIKDEL